MLLARAVASRSLTLLVLGMTTIIVGCGADPQPACTEAYHHLTTLAKRNPDPDGERKFVTTCVDAWDPKRVACLGNARSVGEALACKPFKKRPG